MIEASGPKLLDRAVMLLRHQVRDGPAIVPEKTLRKLRRADELWP